MSCLRRSLGVRLGGLEPGLDSTSLKTSSAASSVFFPSRGGGVAVLLATCSDLLSLVRFRGRAGFSLLCPPKVDESNCLPADGRSRGSVTDRHSVSLAPWGMQEAEQERRKRLLELIPLSSSAAARRLLASALDFFHTWGERKPELPGSRKAPLGTLAPLLAFGDLVGSAASEVRAGDPLMSRPSSSPAPLRSGWPSISRKELLRLGGVGAIFFFFLIKALNRLVFLSLGRRRSSSFRLPSGGPRSFRGSSGDTAGSLSSASETGENNQQRPGDTALRPADPLWGLPEGLLHPQPSWRGQHGVQCYWRAEDKAVAFPTARPCPTSRSTSVSPRSQRGKGWHDPAFLILKPIKVVESLQRQLSYGGMTISCCDKQGKMPL